MKNSMKLNIAILTVALALCGQAEAGFPWPKWFRGTEQAAETIDLQQVAQPSWGEKLQTAAMVAVNGGAQAAKAVGSAVLSGAQATYSFVAPKVGSAAEAVNTGINLGATYVTAKAGVPVAAKVVATVAKGAVIAGTLWLAKKGLDAYGKEAADKVRSVFGGNKPADKAQAPAQQPAAEQPGMLKRGLNAAYNGVAYAASTAARPFTWAAEKVGLKNPAPAADVNGAKAPENKQAEAKKSPEAIRAEKRTQLRTLINDTKSTDAQLDVSLNMHQWNVQAAANTFFEGQRTPAAQASAAQANNGNCANGQCQPRKSTSFKNRR